jgi:uncharacterized membrane protein
MDLYPIIVFVHIASAVALLSGSVVASPAVRAAVRRARTTQDMRSYLAIGRPLLVLEPISAVIVLASGIYLANVAGFWGLGWVQVAVAFWVVNSAVAGAIVKPAITRVAAQLATTADGPVGHHLDTLRRSRKWSFGGDVLMANDAAMLYLMSMKPDLAGSLLVVAFTNAAVAVARAVARRSSRRSPDVDGGLPAGAGLLRPSVSGLPETVADGTAASAEPVPVSPSVAPGVD